MKIKPKIILATQKQYQYLENKLLKIGSEAFKITYLPLADLGIKDVLYFKGFPFITTGIEKIWKKFKVISIRHLGNDFNKWRNAIYKKL